MPISYKNILTKELLYDKYINQNKSIHIIANEFGFTDDTIHKYLRSHNIPIRSWCDKHRSHQKDSFEKLSDFNFLYTEYVINGKSTIEIGDNLQVNSKTVWKYLHKLQIPTRSKFESAATRISFPHKKYLLPLINKYGLDHITSYMVKCDNKAIYEIDEYIPEHKIFIELQGLYWHGYLSKTKKCANSVRRDVFKYLHLKENYPDHKIIYIVESDLTNGLLEQIFEKEFKKCEGVPLIDNGIFEECDANDLIENCKDIKHTPFKCFKHVKSNQIISNISFYYGKHKHIIMNYIRNPVYAQLWDYDFIQFCITSLNKKNIYIHNTIMRNVYLDNTAELLQKIGFKTIGYTKPTYKELTHKEQTFKWWNWPKEIMKLEMSI